MPTLHDLLPIPPGVQQPSAYDIFGLPPGETDPERVSASVVRTVEHLKAIRPTTDPILWQQAARLVDQARRILADPQRKETLDTKLRADTSQESSASADPLGDKLPAGDPLAPALISPAGFQVEQRADSPEASAQPLPELALSPSPGSVQPVVRHNRRRNKRSSLATLVLGVLGLGLLGLVAVLAYFLFYGSGQVEIAAAGDGIRVSTNPPQARQSNVAPPRPTAPKSSEPSPRTSTTRRTADPVMGELAEQTPADQRPSFGQPSGLTRDDEPMARDARSNDAQATIVPSDPPLLGDNVQRQAVARVRTLIRQADWREMKSAAGQLTQMHLAPTRQTEAQSLYELADLATYYRTGIERAVADLEVGNDFEVTPDFRVIVVARGDERLKLQRNRKQFDFTVDEFPFVLAHKLASFQIPEGPTGRAAAAAYQAIAFKATDDHRRQSIEWIEAISGRIEGADAGRLVETIRSLYKLGGKE